MLALALGFGLFAPETRPGARAQQADLNAEARVFFERGNRLFAEATKAEGEKRRDLFEQALQQYVASLRVVRSRNAIFNAAITLEKLDRHQEAFSYLTEYLSISGLTGEERKAGKKRRDALRDDVAVVAVDSDPENAEVHVDRLDLAPRGHTPVEIALEPGMHIVYATLDGYEQARTKIEARKGQRVQAELELEPKPVKLTIDAPEDGRLRLDGKSLASAGTVEVPPGRHSIRLERDGAPPIERTVEIAPGTERVSVELQPGDRGTLLVQTRTPAQVAVDGVARGRGRRVRVPLDTGEHDVRVETDDRVPWQGTIRIEGDATTRVRVTLPKRRRSRRFGTAPWWTGTSAGAVAVAALGVSVRALLLQNEYESLCAGSPPCANDELPRARAKADKVERFNRTADTLWGVTAALGITTIVLTVLNDDLEQPDAEATVGVAPTRGGASVHARIPWEGL